MTEQEYNFEGAEVKKAGVGQFIWNKNTKEFLGRTGLSWAKVSFFYAIFYSLLGAFFIGMLAVFFQIMPQDKPTYYGEDSTMAIKVLNPGLGFRPQVDVEDNLIIFNPSVYENGYKKYTDNMRIFLEDKYSKPATDDNLIDCVDGHDHNSELEAGKACKYDYEELFKNTSCTKENFFGYNSNKICVIVKLNKIVSWLPLSDDKNVKITCEGETSADMDNIKPITYHSEGKNNNQEAGYLDAKYFPYYNQPGYRAPFVFVEVEAAVNTLVNIRCIASALNIDHEDRMNLRGMTKFSIYVKS
jgi:sodium/potassium-transporting ATPase subunit beta